MEVIIFFTLIRDSLDSSLNCLPHDSRHSHEYLKVVLGGEKFMEFDEAEQFQAVGAVVLIIESYDHEFVAILEGLTSERNLEAKFLHPRMIGGVRILVNGQHRRTREQSRQRSGIFLDCLQLFLDHTFRMTT